MAKTYFGKLDKVIHEGRGSLIGLVEVNGRKYKVPAKLKGDMPKVGTTVSFTCDGFEREPWQDNPERYNMVAKSATLTADIGKPVSRQGVIAKVLFPAEAPADGKKFNACVLVDCGFTTKNGNPSYEKVYLSGLQSLPAAGQHFSMDEGYRVKEPLKDDPERYNLAVHAMDWEIRTPKEYQGEITRVFHYDAENQSAIVLGKFGFKNDAETKAYLTLDKEPQVGDRIALRGIVEEEIQTKDGKPILRDDGEPFTNLVIRETRTSRMEAAPEEEEDSGPSPGF